HQRRYYVYNQTVIHPRQHLSHRAVCPFYGKPDADHVRYYPVHSISSFYGNPFSRLDPEHLYRYCRTGSFPAAGPTGDFLYPSLVFHPGSQETLSSCFLRGLLGPAEYRLFQLLQSDLSF
ncbi:MAG: hypothetical protein Q4B44_05485, partial [Erysipelotrichaceae bacterium]|nr:hypothetical protein [Erysipelotrichaceae bacterium]